MKNNLHHLIVAPNEFPSVFIRVNPWLIKILVYYENGQNEQQR
jgi:hypothetical protein